MKSARASCARYCLSAKPSVPERFPFLSHLRAALHPLGAPPADAPWNLAELRDLLPDELTPAAVLIGIVTHDEPTLIFTRRNEVMTHHAGQISFPGGRVEPDEGPIAAALREAEEEIGLPPSAVTPLGFLDPYATITGFRVMPLVATVTPGQAYRMAPLEVAEVFETPLSVVLHPDAIEQREREWRGRLRRYHVIPWEGRDIWGATAAMLVNLRERLGRAEAA